MSWQIGLQFMVSQTTGLAVVTSTTGDAENEKVAVGDVLLSIAGQSLSSGHGLSQVGCCLSTHFDRHRSPPACLLVSIVVVVQNHVKTLGWHID